MLKTSINFMTKYIFIPAFVIILMVIVNGVNVTAYEKSSEDSTIIGVIKDVPVYFDDNIVTVTASGRFETYKLSYSSAYCRAGETLTIEINSGSDKIVKAVTINGCSYEFTQLGNIYTTGCSVAINQGSSGVTITVTLADAPRTISVCPYVYCSAGSSAEMGKMIFFYANPPAGYGVKNFTINGTPYSLPATYVMGDSNVTTSCSIYLLDYTLSVSEGVTVLRNGLNMLNGSKVQKNDVLTITAQDKEGYTLSNIKVNGTAITSGSIFTVGTSNVTIIPTYTPIDYSIEIPQGVEVIRNSVVLSDTDYIHKGDILTIISKPQAGYTATSLKVNGTDFVSGETFTVGAQNVAIETEFSFIDYTLSIPANITVTKGTVELLNGSTVHIGDSLIVTAKEKEGYNLTSLQVNTAQFISGSTYIVGASDVSVSAVYTPIDYNVTIPIGITVTRNGATLPNNAVVHIGDPLVVAAESPMGYTVDVLKANNIEITSEQLLIAPAANVAFTVSFKPIDYIVTIPEGVTVKKGESILVTGDKVHINDILTVTATQKAGYTLTSLTVNGVEIPVNFSYTVGTSDILFTVEYTPIDYHISVPDKVQVTRNDIILPNNSVVHIDDILVITALPDMGFETTELKVAGNSVLSGNKFTVGTTDIVITVTFDYIDYTLTIPTNVSVLRNGIALNDGDIIHIDNILEITALPPMGFELASLKVNNNNFSSGNIFTVGITDIVITVDFDFIDYILNLPEKVNVLRNGVKLLDNSVVHIGDTLVITATPDMGYETTELKVNEYNFISGNIFTVGTIDLTVSVAFAPINYTLTIPANISVLRNGASLKNGDKVHINDVLVITATPPIGFKIAAVKVNGNNFMSGNSFTVGITDIAVTATFDYIDYALTLPANVNVLRNGVSLKDSDSVQIGDILTILAEPLDGYTTSLFTVNGVDFVSGNEYTVSSEDITVAAEFELIDYVVTFPSPVQVHKGTDLLVSGDVVHINDELTVSVDLEENQALTTLNINGIEIASGDTFTVGSENVVITAEIAQPKLGLKTVLTEIKEQLVPDTATISKELINFDLDVPLNIHVYRNNEELHNGDIVYEGDTLLIFDYPKSVASLSGDTSDGVTVTITELGETDLLRALAAFTQKKALTRKLDSDTAAKAYESAISNKVSTNPDIPSVTPNTSSKSTTRYNHKPALYSAPSYVDFISESVTETTSVEETVDEVVSYKPVIMVLEKDTNKPISSISVVAINTDTQERFDLYTDDNGQVIINGLKPGNYLISQEATTEDYMLSADSFYITVDEYGVLSNDVVFYNTAVRKIEDIVVSADNSPVTTNDEVESKVFTVSFRLVCFLSLLFILIAIILIVIYRNSKKLKARSKNDICL